MVRILVIEDEESIRENIVEALELSEYDVMSASNGADGIQLAYNHHPDLILCDIMMAGMDGYGVLDNIRRTSDVALTPFIFLTAKSDRASMRYGMEMGADDYISKPFTTDELLSAIQIRIGRFTDVEDHVNDELTETKRQLAQLISHELRTPLTSINMAVQLMSQQLDLLSAEDTQSLIDVLGNGTNRLNRLVEQMSLFIQAKSGLLNAEKVMRASRPQNIWTLVSGAINQAQHFMYREHNVQVNFDPKGDHIEISCFRDLLSHAFAEVIANAVSFSPENGHVNITVQCSENEIHVCVQDYGNGMTSEQIDTALQDFSQVEREQQEQQGLGIGLPLTNLIVQSHGGRFDIQSYVGEGTTVHIYLPYQS